MHPFEIAQLGSLGCDDADEAKTLIPSLANKRTDEELQDLLDHVSLELAFYGEVTEFTNWFIAPSIWLNDDWGNVDLAVVCIIQGVFQVYVLCPSIVLRDIPHGPPHSC